MLSSSKLSFRDPALGPSSLDFYASNHSTRLGTTIAAAGLLLLCE
jgi:hypothetical protein